MKVSFPLVATSSFDQETIGRAFVGEVLDEAVEIWASPHGSFAHVGRMSIEKRAIEVQDDELSQRKSVFG